MYFKDKNNIHNLSFINVHSPTDKKDKIEKEVFYQKIEEAYDIWDLIILKY
jgi:hypothetical protein